MSMCVAVQRTSLSSAAAPFTPSAPRSHLSSIATPFLPASRPRTSSTILATDPRQTGPPAGCSFSYGNSCSLAAWDVASLASTAVDDDASSAQSDCESTSHTSDATEEVPKRPSFTVTSSSNTRPRAMTFPQARPRWADICSDDEDDDDCPFVMRNGDDATLRDGMRSVLSSAPWRRRSAKADEQ